MYPVLPTTVKLRSSIAPKIATNLYDPYTKQIDQNVNWFGWDIIIIPCYLPLSNYGRPLHPNMPPTRMTHIPSTMIKMTTDFVDKSSLPSHWQCNLPLPNYGRPLHPKLPPNRMTYIPSTMMKMTTSLSSVIYHRQIMVVHCTQNCHLLVWPIFQAQWSKYQQILLNNHPYSVLPTTAKLWSSIAA